MVEAWALEWAGGYHSCWGAEARSSLASAEHLELEMVEAWALGWAEARSSPASAERLESETVQAKALGWAGGCHS